MRDFWNEKKVDLDSDKSTEKICPVNECQYYLNPFGTCELNYPSYFGKINELKFTFKKPSESSIDLMKYYEDIKICPTGLIKRELFDESPVIHKSFWSDPEKVYTYPLEIIRIIPETSDAGPDARSLMKKIQPRPHIRFKLVQDNYKNVIVDVSDLNFPIITEEIVNENSMSIEKVSFTNPKYLLKHPHESDFPSLEYKEKEFFKDSCNNKKTIHFKVLYFRIDGRIKEMRKILESKVEKVHNIETYKFFAGIENVIYNQKLIRNFADFKNTLKEVKNDEFDFYILISDFRTSNFHNKIKSYLIQKDIPNQTIRIKTLFDLGIQRLRALIFLQIYLKSRGSTWILKDIFNENEVIIGFSLKFFKDKIIAALLFFTNQGEFIEGIYLNEKSAEFIKQLEENFVEKIKKYEKIFFLSLGSITHKVLDIITSALKEKNHEIMEISSYSIIRIFDQDEKNSQKIFAPKPGKGIILNNKECHLITSKTKIGTPTCIRIDISSIKSVDDYLQRIFNFTRYHPGLVRNDIKLPFPLHFARATLRKGIRLNLKSFEFKIPFYL